MVKKKAIKNQSKSWLKVVVILIILLFTGSITVIIISFYRFEKEYKGKIYPGVRIDNILFDGKTSSEVENFFVEKSKPFSKIAVMIAFENKLATISGQALNISYDAKLSSVQAYSIGRSGNTLSDIYLKWRAMTDGINLTSVFRINMEIIDETLTSLASSIDISSQDALFQFDKGKVTSFRLSKTGRKLDKEQTKQLILSYITKLADNESQLNGIISVIPIVYPVNPAITTENSNSLGIKELLAVGTSKFAGSIASRIHNIELATSRINGRLIPPNSIFSFNDALGDVSAATGFQPAYIIKDGRTVLGDGGGVCQVSTTLFRAILNAGLSIVERYPHSYRVSYYEQGFPPGLDATVFAPSYDLKFKNDTKNHILIQAIFDRKNYTLAFEFYGTSDGRQAEITKPVILSQIAPPEDLYQDDPTLPRGVVKQVDWRAWGAKVVFNYKVKRDNETITDDTFTSKYQPWQAVFLKGTRE